ncbi:quinone oxidoreductase family protein [Bradyrhizobium sp.]|uniref:quinone oxidoreductase family protein n=1 Tax=Bradyrhizobium sp. TaxID=376 RepID=UPI003C6904EC
MKAAVYDRAGPPDVLRFATVDDPVCRADDVLIRVEAVAVEGGDIFARSSIEPPAPDHIGGYAAAGTVIRVGSDDLEFAIGDRVATMAVGGSHAELRAVNVQGCFRIPDGLDMAKAAAVPVPFLTAHHALFDVAQIQADDTILIQGAAGSVGLAAVQLAARHGARVLAVQAGTERAPRLRVLGASIVIDRKNESVVEVVREATEGRMASVVLDTVGGASLDTSILSTCPFGRVLMIGNASQVPMRPDLWPAMTNNITLSGVSVRPMFGSPASKSVIEDIMKQARDGHLDVIIDKSFQLSEAARAHRYVEESSPLGRVVLTPSLTAAQ